MVHTQSEESICAWRVARRGVMLIKFGLAVLVVFTCVAMRGQTYTVIHDFTGGYDGANPYTGLTIDAHGNIYGTAFTGGGPGFGTVFSLDNSGDNWYVTPLYSFTGGSDGAGPMGRIVIGQDGALYGSTSAGGSGPCNPGNGYLGCGIVYQLRPPVHAPASAIFSWNSTVLYRFSGTDGAYPQGDLIFDQAGTMYGTTINGGSDGWGAVYTLTPSNGGWTENLLYQVRNDGDGQYPWGGLVFDQAGNLYGVFSGGGPSGYGAVYKLTRSGSGWNESTVHAFTFHGDDGAAPQGGLIADASGNLYGTTVHDLTGGGIAFQLTPSGDNWLYNFVAEFLGGINLGPYDKLVMDSAGNLYGTTFADGLYAHGSVFKLTPTLIGWTYTSLHDFTGGNDGGNPTCSLVLDANGNLYGTASSGGANDDGVIFQITP